MVEELEKVKNDGVEISMSRVDVDCIFALRRTVLRPGLSMKSVQWPGDSEPSTWHFAAFRLNDQRKTTGDALCCVSYFENKVPLTEEQGLQLRGMATEPEYQGRGFGKRLLRFAEQIIVAQTEHRLFWCNARASALEFYLKQQWECVSTVFDIPTAGPHYRMIKRITRISA